MSLSISQCFLKPRKQLVAACKAGPEAASLRGMTVKGLWHFLPRSAVQQEPCLLHGPLTPSRHALDPCLLSQDAVKEPWALGSPWGLAGTRGPGRAPGAGRHPGPEMAELGTPRRKGARADGRQAGTRRREQAEAKCRPAAVSPRVAWSGVSRALPVRSACTTPSCSAMGRCPQQGEQASRSASGSAGCLSPHLHHPSWVWLWVFLICVFYKDWKKRRGMVLSCLLMVFSILCLLRS